MNWKNKEIDMLHGPLAGKLLLFTLPIALSSMVQQLFNAADTAVVGYFGSEGALTAVGTNTEIIALVITLSSGLSIGANILIANHVGRNETKELPAAVQTAMLMAVLLGMAGLLLGQAAAVPLLRRLQTPEDIFEEAALYLRLYMLGYPFLLLYDFGARRQPLSVFRTDALGRRERRAQFIFRGRAPHGCRWSRDLNGCFHHALSAAGAAAAQEGRAVPLYIPRAEILLKKCGKHPEDRRSLCRAGSGILLCRSLCAGVGQPLRRDCDRRKHNHDEL